MAGTVTSDSTPIHNCDAVSTWTGSPTLDTEIYIEGSGAMSAKVSKTTSTFMYPISSTDLSDTVIIIWILGASVAQFNTKALGGIAIRVENGATPDYTEWYVAGSDEGYDGGWQPLSVRTTETPDSVSGGDDLTVANAVGVVFDVTGSSSKVNVWWDNVHYGTTVTISAGTSGSPATFADIITQEATSRWGFFTEVEGVLFAQCKLKIGSTVAAADTYFLDTSKFLVFRDKGFGTFFDITFQGNATGTTEIYFGVDVGGRGVSGMIISAAGTTSKPTLTVTDTNVDNIGLYGCTFLGFSTIALPAYSVDYNVLSCNFENCDQIDPDDGTVTFCNFIATTSADGAVLIDQTDHRVTYCNFINNAYGVEHSLDGTYSHVANGFAGNTVDVQNSSVAVLVDSYTPTEDGDVDVYTGSISQVAQQFTGVAGDLSRAIFSIRKQGTPTGNIFAYLYANSGGAPTGAALATSEAFDIADLTTSFADVGLELEDEYTLAGATEYHIAIEFDGGDSGNRLEVEYLTAGDGGETCNTYTGTWGSQTYDCRFQTNRDGIAKLNASLGANPGTTEETDTVKGATIIVNTVSLEIACVNKDNDAVEGVQCSVWRASDNLDLMNEDSAAVTGVAQEDFNYPGSEVAINWRARKSETTDDPRYKAVSGTGIINTTGFSVTATMEEQPLPI